MKVVYVFPTPENVGITQYIDQANTCYIYEKKEVTCPTDESLVSSIPLQT